MGGGGDRDREGERGIDRIERRETYREREREKREKGERERDRETQRRRE